MACETLPSGGLKISPLNNSYNHIIMMALLTLLQIGIIITSNDEVTSITWEIVKWK
jgi:hypothetical protein